VAEATGPRAGPGRAPGLGRAPGEARRARGQRGRVQRGRKYGHGPRLRADVRACKALGARTRMGRGPEGPGVAEGQGGLAPKTRTRTRAIQGPGGLRRAEPGARGPSPAERRQGRAPGWREAAESERPEGPRGQTPGAVIRTGTAQGRITRGRAAPGPPRAPVSGRIGRRLRGATIVAAAAAPGGRRGARAVRARRGPPPSLPEAKVTARQGRSRAARP
jgi:hypothetical protein